MKTQFKTIIVGLFLILFFVGCKSEKTENDLTKANLKGKVKSVKEISYYTKDKFGEAIKDEKYQQIEFYFNEQGYITEKTERNFKTSGYSFSSYKKETLKYNQQNNIVEKYIYNDVLGETTSIITYQYDENENLIEEKQSDENGKLWSRSIFKYDKNNNQIEYERYNYFSDEELSYKYVYKYDEKGNKTEENIYNSDGELESKSIYKYDNRGNKIEENNYSSNGKLEEKFIYKYDNKGNKTEENKYNSIGELEYKSIYKYDSKGNKIEAKSYNSDDTLTYEWTCEYDKKGNKRETQQNNYNSYGKLQYSYFYKYDERGNTIVDERTEFESVPKYTNLKFIGDSNMKSIYHDTHTKRNSFLYDENNNITEEITYSSWSLGSKLVFDIDVKSNYTYQLDSKKNWIVKTGIEKNRVWTIIEREIEYYQ